MFLPQPSPSDLPFGCPVEHNRSRVILQVCVTRVCVAEIDTKPRLAVDAVALLAVRGVSHVRWPLLVVIPDALYVSSAN